MSENNKTLHDILKKYQEIEMILVESNGEIDENLEKLLLDNEVELNKKLDGYEKFSRYLKSQVEYLKNMEEHYNKRRKILENSILKCKESMLSALRTTNKQKLKTNEFNFSVGKSEKWNVDTESITDIEKSTLIDDGCAESVFKINLNKIKNTYKDTNKKVPNWIEIQERLFIRVS